MRADHADPALQEPTQLIRPPRRRPVKPAATRGFAERLALFVTGVDRSHAEELLAGLADCSQRRAAEFAHEALMWDSATRQGRMAVTFGNHPRAADRLKQLIADASPLLGAAVFRRLAPWQQSLFPRLQGKASIEPTEAMDALAERLIREATR